MCGIVGYVGNQKAVDILIEGLRRLEYRGYDSAGIALISETSGSVLRIRSTGKIKDLVSKIAEHNDLKSTIGIGHTRWATHGPPTEENAHPHKSGPFIVVHNGIVENYTELKGWLIEKGHNFESDTDTEVIVKLVEHYWHNESLSERYAIMKALKRIRGSYAVVFLSELSPRKLYACRFESPLVVGNSDDGMYIASDIPALLPFTREIMYLEDGDFIEVTSENVSAWNLDNVPVERKFEVVDINPVAAEKGGFRHFMQKEIFEQPRALSDTIKPYLNMDNYGVFLPDASCLESLLPSIKKICFIACGTSYHAAMVGKYIFEYFLGINVEVDLASEFRYRRPIINKDTLVIAISQSGETADTKGALIHAQSLGARSCSIVNVVGSGLTRMSDAVIYTHAGPEIGVASTKAFVTQLAALILFVLFYLERLKSRKNETYLSLAKALLKIPTSVEEMLRRSNKLKSWVHDIAVARSCLYLGRNILFPIALEGALKLKEISYIHAEGYAAGEMKHGPIALIDENVPVICLVQYGPMAEKMLSNIEEVRARGGKVFIVADERLKNMEIDQNSNRPVIWVPATHEYLSPILFTIPLQLLAYYVAVERGTDVDQPRNLAKSVTVE